MAVGLALMGAVLVALYGQGAGCQAWALRLGLAGGVLASAAGQCLLILGLWLIWRGLGRSAGSANPSEPHDWPCAR